MDRMYLQEGYRAAPQQSPQCFFQQLMEQIAVAEAKAHSATKSDGLVHARVEVDALHTASEDERLEALDRWELMTLNEEMRGLPLREYPHRPGVFQYGTANECPKPGVAGIAVAPQTRWLDDWQSEDKEWDETMWRLPRNRSKAKP